LTGAWRWGTAAVGLWTAAWAADVLLEVPDRSAADVLWFVTAVTALCSLVAVLGAKRPGARVWTWFVLAPLFLVLGWPAVASWSADTGGNGLTLETPALVPVMLVLVMGAGNYFGTRFWPAAALLSLALALLVAPLTAALPAAQDHAEALRTAATLCFSAAFIAAARCAQRLPIRDVGETACFPPAPANGLQEAVHFPARPTLAASATRTEALDRLWTDFRDWFGIVWAKRILDRVNLAGQQEQWPARLHMHGLVWHDREHLPEVRRHTLERVEYTLRWLMRRFAEPDWIDARLGVLASADPQQHAERLVPAADISVSQHPFPSASSAPATTSAPKS
jgi:hypothetical protein